MNPYSKKLDLTSSDFQKKLDSEISRSREALVEKIRGLVDQATDDIFSNLFPQELHQKYLNSDVDDEEKMFVAMTIANELDEYICNNL